MEPNKTIAQHLEHMAGNRRIRAFLIAVLVLAVLAVLQVGNLNRNPPMCELLSNCKLGNGDLQRMQIALSQAGMGEYQLKNNQLLVPAAKHAEYLQALAEQNAIPAELRDSIEKLPSVNPFLSRSQQMAIERAEKKHHVREMVLRLPFVEQAWFEMDKSESHSAFEQAEHSAVVSIRTPENTSLTDQHVDTVKRMIGGAVAGLNSDAIVVIDLSEGFAHQQNDDPSTTRQVHFRRIAFEQQRFYEQEIRNVLKQYPGVEVSVRVEVLPTPKADKLTAATGSWLRLDLPQNLPHRHDSEPFRFRELPKPGANSFASIDGIQSQPEATVQRVTHEEAVPGDDPLIKQISVYVNVPQSLVHELYGSPNSSSSSTKNPNDLRAALDSDAQRKFQRLQTEIVQKIRPLLPAATFGNGTEFPIAVNLIRKPITNSHPWTVKARTFVAQNWPSAAVLALGLMLLSIVTRKQDAVPSLAKHVDSEENLDVVSINSTNAKSIAPTDANAEVQLSKLIEKDPDAAAKVIESWIRDAA